MSASSTENNSRLGLLKIYLPVAIIVIAGFALAISKLDPPLPDKLRIATGSTDGAYHAFAERYQALIAEEGLDIQVEIVETAGSVENLELLESRRVDLALVQGGASGGLRDQGLETLASIFVEPVWIFYRSELSVERLADLEGREIAIGAPGSGTRPLALLLLEISGIHTDNASFHEISSAETVELLEAGGLDAGFFVASIEAPYVGRLLRDDNFSLLSFSRHRAYSLHFPFLSRVVLGEGIVDMRNNLPTQDISLLAAASSLVAQQDLHEAMIPLFIETLKAVHGTGAVFDTAGGFPSSRFADEKLPMAPEARIYLEQGPSFLHQVLPFKFATAFDRMKILLLPFITLLIPLFRVAPPLYRWRTRSQIYRWYEDLRSVDQVLHRKPEREELLKHIARVRQMEQEVSDEVSVPLSYMDEFYRLRTHIDLILNQLQRLEAEDNDPKPGG